MHWESAVSQEYSGISARLANGQEDKLDRAVADDNSRKALGRGADTHRGKSVLLAASAVSPFTELEATISGILKEFKVASEEPIKGFEELKTNQLSFQEVLESSAELRPGRELTYWEEIKGSASRRLLGKRFLGRTWSFKPGGDEEEVGLFSEYQQRANQRFLPDLVRWENGSVSATGQHSKSKLIAIQFTRNAQAAQKRANKAECVGLRQASECDHGSHKSDEDEQEGNDTRIMITEAGRKNLEAARKPKPRKPEFGEAERWSEDQDGKVSQDEAEVTIVNKASSNIQNKPVSKPGVSPLLVSN
ncbi:hypothetical protein HOY80DRAFT_1098876 [Tuber brumale]|nr:hypothetical protein HOY80DRAFT_1098876 [Tuber brumale]